MTIEERLDALEAQVAELRERLGLNQTTAHWLDRIAGSFKDDPEFDEVLRLGRKIRQSDRPPEDPQSES